MRINCGHIFALRVTPEKMVVPLHPSPARLQLRHAVAVDRRLEELAGPQVPEHDEAGTRADGQDVALEGDGANAAVLVPTVNLADRLNKFMLMKQYGANFIKCHINLSIQSFLHDIPNKVNKMLSKVKDIDSLILISFFYVLKLKITV